MLIGLIAFLVSGIIVGLLLSKSNPMFGMLLVGAIGGLLMGLMLRMFNKLYKIVILSTVGTFIGIIIGFALGEVIASLSPFLEESEIPNIILFIIMNAIYGAILAPLFHGRKSIWFFALVCGIVSIPIGLLLIITNGIVWGGLDLNFLVIVTSLGTTSGLSIGLYSLLKLKSKDDIK